MPTQVKAQYPCGGCLKMRNPQRFSNTAIRKYESAVAFARTKKRPVDEVRKPICGDCSRPSVHEHMCAKCGIMKSADLFSGQQKKRGDDKECRDCVQERQDREANFEDEKREQEIMEALKNGNSSSGLFTSTFSMTANSHPSRFPGSNDLSSHSDFDDAGWAPDPVPIPEDPRIGSQGSDLSGRMDHLSISSYDAQSVTGTNVTRNTTGTQWDNFERTYAPYREQGRGSATSVTSKGGNPGFVKQAAVKQDPHLKAAIQLERQRKREREQAEQAAYNESGSDDDDDDSDNDAPY